MQLEYLRNVSHAGSKEAQQKFSGTYCKQSVTSLWTLLQFYSSAKHRYSTQIFIRLYDGHFIDTVGSRGASNTSL